MDTRSTGMTLPDLLQQSSSYWRACALHAAVKLDLFSPLAEGPRTAVDVAAVIQGDERGVAMLLHALVAMEVLTKDEGRFRLTVLAAEHLVRTSPAYMGHILMHHHFLVEGWAKLDEAVHAGVPVRRRSSHETEGAERESFLLGMYNLASLLAPRIAREIDLQDRRHLLDLAGGPGTYAIHFCLHNPQLTAVIHDLPTTRPFAEQTVTRFGLDDRIAFTGGDILAEPIGSGFDVVWISHLLHSEGPESCKRIVAQATKALDAGGLLLIQEFILDEARTAPLHPALFSLNMLLGTREGQVYTQGELSGMMTAAGLRDIRRLAITLPNGAGIMAGIR